MSDSLDGQVQKAESRETARFWEQLLQVIEEGRVLPVVGRDLLVASIDGRQVHLYDELARRLAIELEVNVAEGELRRTSLNDVASRHLARGGDLEEISTALKSVMPTAAEFPVPDVLATLAAVEPFRLFVTTTFDTLLVQALDRIRFGGQRKSISLAFSPTSAEDLPCELRHLDRPCVYHLLGRLSAIPEYAVTDEDTLEFVHSLQSEGRRPKLLFDELGRQHLLILGSGFPSWLTRFFLRVTKGERLWMARGKTDFVVDEAVHSDPELLWFLEAFKTRTRVFPAGGVAAFVAELAQRWSARQPAREIASVSAVATERAKGVSTVEAGVVFLSYPSEDLDIVKQIRSDLEAAGIDVWLDMSQLRGGHDYEERILRGIDECSLFVPIISRHALTMDRRFFRLEWKHAERIAAQMPRSRRFIVPLAIDDTPYDADEIPRDFRALHWERLPGGATTPEFLETMRELFRRFQKRAAGVT